MAVTAFIGGGKMGEAIMSGLLASGVDAQDIMVVEKVADRCDYLLDTYGVVISDLETAAARADNVIIAVKPQGFDEVLTALRPHLRPDAIVISIAAGKTLATMERLLPGAHCVRVMPNTPALVREGMSAVSAGTHVTAADLRTARELLETVGRVVIVPEAQQDATTAVHGSGPAFFYYFMECLVDGGVALGLEPELAYELALQTFIGSAELIKQTGETATQLRANVTSPNGTTHAAITAFDRLGLRERIAEGQRAGSDRAAELSAG